MGGSVLFRRYAADWEEAERLRAYVAAVRSALARPDGINRGVARRVVGVGGEIRRAP